MAQLRFIGNVVRNKTLEIFDNTFIWDTKTAFVEGGIY